MVIKRPFVLSQFLVISLYIVYPLILVLHICTVMPENQKCISEMGESLLPKQATFSHKFYTVNECHRASKVTHLL